MSIQHLSDPGLCRTAREGPASCVRAWPGPPRAAGRRARAPRARSARAPRGEPTEGAPEKAAGIRGNHLSDATCLTQTFFQGVE